MNLKPFESDYLLSMAEEPNYPLVAKWLPVRKKEVIEFNTDLKVLILEPLVADLVPFEEGKGDINEFIFENSSLEREEIKNLPLSIYKTLQDKIFSFTKNKTEIETETETIKKN